MCRSEKDLLCVYVCVLNHVQLFVTPWTVSCQVPLSMGFFRQEYWSGVPFPSPEDLSDSGIKLTFPASPALAGRFLTTQPSGKLGKKLILEWIYQLVRIWGTLWFIYIYIIYILYICMMMLYIYDVLYIYTYYQCIITMSKQKVERKAQFECKVFYYWVRWQSIVLFKKYDKYIWLCQKNVICINITILSTIEFPE